ncbi:unnamed protein product [Absidia cylindrospora]
METSSHHKVDRHVSIANKPVFKLPTTLPRNFLALQQSLTSSPAPTTTSSSSTSSRSSVISPYVLSIANTMKLRMKAAVNTMVWNGNRRNTLLTSIVSPSSATGTVTTTPSSLCDLQQQKQQLGQHQKNVSSSPMLKNGALLKQYLTFVQEETGVIMDMDLLNSSATDDSYQPSFETQQNHLASSGAALVESIIHRSTSKLDAEKLSGCLPSTVSSTKPVTPQRRTSRPIKSTSVAVALKMEEEEKRFKKSERLRLKHQRKSRWTPLKTTMISNKNKKEHATSAGSAAAVIRCICATPNEEFGSMVQCDDCACWLHLECLALNEDALDETFRCPSCSISLGPGQHLTSAITWRFAAQLKSQRLANRHNTTTEAVTTSSNKWNNKRKNISYRRGSDRKHSQGSNHPLHRHYRSQQRIQHHQKEKRRRLHHSRRPILYSAQGDSSSSSSSSSDSDDNTDEQQHHRTWMIPKMTIHSSIHTTMTTSTGNVLVQKLNNHRSPTTSTGGNSINTYDNDTDADEDMAVDSDTTESDWESGDRYQYYHRRRSCIHDEEDDDYSQDTATSTSTWASFSSINTTPSLTLSPSHAGSDTDSPCEASTPPDEHFGHDDSYMQVMTDNNNTTTDTEQVMLSTTATSACLDQESLLWLSRLAYLESLQSSTRQQCFTPHASDVFLCGEQQKGTTMMIGQGEEDSQDHHHYSQLTRVPLLATARSDPPSAICSHDLSQFSFDAGPFWSPIQ